jgi:hypothetical protein
MKCSILAKWCSRKPVQISCVLPLWYRLTHQHFPHEKQQPDVRNFRTGTNGETQVCVHRNVSMKGEYTSALSPHFCVTSRREGLEIDFPRHADFGDEIWICKERSQPSSARGSSDKGSCIGQKHLV